MSVLAFLASQQNRNDDLLNKQLAEEIIRDNRMDWIKELAENLNHRDKNIQSDCVKTLYEIGLRGAFSMIATYAENFIKLLASKNNRMVWGAMIALNCITDVVPEKIFIHLSDVMKAVDNGSVITIDNGVSILAKLAKHKEYENVVLPLLMEQLKKCPIKQFPLYIEKSLIAINNENKMFFVNIIEQRFKEINNEAQKKRISKILKIIEQKFFK